jgi:hypothetical protein
MDKKEIWMMENSLLSTTQIQRGQYMTITEINKLKVIDRKHASTWFVIALICIAVSIGSGLVYVIDQANKRQALESAIVTVLNQCEKAGYFTVSNVTYRCDWSAKK